MCQPPAIATVHVLFLHAHKQTHAKAIANSVTACLEPWSMSSKALRTLCLLVHNQLFPRHNVTPSPKDYGSYRAYVQMPQATLSLSFNAFTRVLQHGSATRALDKCHSFNT